MNEFKLPKHQSKITLFAYKTIGYIMLMITLGFSTLFLFDRFYFRYNTKCRKSLLAWLKREKLCNPLATGNNDYTVWQIAYNVRLFYCGKEASYFVAHRMPSGDEVIDSIAFDWSSRRCRKRILAKIEEQLNHHERKA